MPYKNSKYRYKQISVKLPVIEEFEKVYPSCYRVFITRALQLATQSKSEFERIFFNPMFLEVR